MIVLPEEVAVVVAELRLKAEEAVVLTFVEDRFRVLLALTVATSPDVKVMLD